MADQASRSEGLPKQEEPIFFTSPEELRDWFSRNHQSVKACWVGFYKKGSGTPSITWPESVDEALCYGWIDGVRKGIDNERYMIRFTPRKSGSIWSAVNIARVEALTAEGWMQPEGLAAYQQRKEDRSAIYAYEQEEPAELNEEELREFQANEKAWNYFKGMAPSYQKSAIHGIVSAKRADTRRKRLLELITDSEQERKIARLDWGTKGKSRRSVQE